MVNPICFLVFLVGSILPAAAQAVVEECSANDSRCRDAAAAAAAAAAVANNKSTTTNTPAASSTFTGTDSITNPNNNNVVIDSCSVYMAPSSIPGAGWGLYTAVDLQEGDAIGEGDMLIPIEDKYKTIPYRGQQRFLSWLGYIWPDELETFYHSSTKAFPPISKSMYGVEEGLSWATNLGFYNKYKRLNAFVPGLASLLNSHTAASNVRRRVDSQTRVKPPSKNASTRFHGIVMEANQTIAAGSELFLYYGAQFHMHVEKKAQSRREYDTLHDYNEKWNFEKLPTEADKRGQMHPETRFKNHTLKGVGARLKKFDIANTTVNPVASTTPPPRELSWLESHGTCVDNLRVDRARNRKKMGRAAFAKRMMAAGSVIAPAPLLTLKREDLVMYEYNPELPKRHSLNLSNPIGQELVLNYCYSHPDSEVLLLPYSPIVNYINHNATHANAMIRWTADAERWLSLHPIDVLDMSGKISMEFVALRDIAEGEQITIDYGKAWSEAWNAAPKESEFRHAIGVPDGFFPKRWLKTSVKYEVQDVKKRLEPGELQQLRWKHNGKPVSKYAYRMGLPENFSQHMLDYTERLGLVEKFKKLLFTDVLKSDEWHVFDTTSEGGEWFAQRYKSTAWHFNMHYVAGWDEVARRSFLREMGHAGFDIALDALGTNFDLDNITCFHTSYMGVSECDNSFTHTDVYATGERSFNIIWPIIVVNGSKPELDVQSDDANIVTAVNYEYDTAIIMGDWGYHKTSPIDNEDAGDIRIVVGMYCGQLDDSTRNMMAHIYDGEDPAPFMGQFFEKDLEYHWSKSGQYSLTQL